MINNNNRPNDDTILNNVAAFLQEQHEDAKEKVIEKFIEIMGTDNAEQVKKKGYHIYTRLDDGEGGELQKELLLLYRGDKPITGFWIKAVLGKDLQIITQPISEFELKKLFKQD